MGQAIAQSKVTLRKDSMEAESMSSSFRERNDDLRSIDNETINLEDFVLTNTLARLDEKLATDPSSICGFDEFRNFKHKVFDVEEFEFFDGDNDFELLDKRLVEEFGRDYSIRYHVITINE